MTLNQLEFEIIGGGHSTVTVKRLLNAGYAGKDQEAVRDHIEELAELGVPAPSTTPTLYPVSPYLAQQTDWVSVQHSKTSGEAEWALVIDDDGRELLTVACDHTDRDLETYGVAWSKNASPDVLGTKAFLLDSIRETYGQMKIEAWVGHDKKEIQSGVIADLLLPDYWLEVLEQRGERQPGTILLSGTIPMVKGADQFSNRWEVKVSHPFQGEVSLAYDVIEMSKPIG